MTSNGNKLKSYSNMKFFQSFSAFVLAGLAIGFASCGSKQQPSALLQEPETNIIDSLQQIVAEEVAAQMGKVQAECACAVLINKDGQLVAIVETAPDTISASGDIEAGSIIIPFSILAAHHNALGIDSSSTVSITKWGYMTDKFIVLDSHPMDTTLKVRDVIAFSSNPGTCQLLQDFSYYIFERRFNEMGILNETRNKSDMFCHAIGMELCTSPIHIAWLYHCLGQGLFPEEWDVVSSGVIEGLHDCVWNNNLGTASARKWGDRIVEYRAQSARVPIIGKTGSAFMNSPFRVNLISFVGIFPKNEPQYTCLVLFKTSQNSPLCNAGNECGSAVRRIAERIMLN